MSSAVTRSREHVGVRRLSLRARAHRRRQIVVLVVITWLGCAALATHVTIVVNHGLPLLDVLCFIAAMACALLTGVLLRAHHPWPVCHICRRSARFSVTYYPDDAASSQLGAKLYACARHVPRARRVAVRESGHTLVMPRVIDTDATAVLDVMGTSREKE